MGKDPRAPGSFTEEDHSVLRNLAKRVSRELQLGYEERRRLRAQDQALFVSQLLQEGQGSQLDISRRSTKESPGMSAVNRDQLSLGMSLLSTNAADSLVSAINKMCKLSTATSATVLDMRSFVKSSNESSTVADPRRPALRRTYSATVSTQRAQGTVQGADGTAFSVQRLRPIGVLGTSRAESGLSERLNGQESLLSIERALQQWRLVSQSITLVSLRKLTSLKPTGSQARLPSQRRSLGPAFLGWFHRASLTSRHPPRHPHPRPRRSTRPPHHYLLR